MLPVGRRGRGGGVALAGPGVLIAAPDALLPEDLPILHREPEDDEVVSLVAREKDALAPDAGGSAGPAGERGPPENVLPLLRPVGWQSGRGRRAVVVGPAPIGPVLGRNRLDEKRHQRGEDGGREGAGHGRGSRGCLAGVKRNNKARCDSNTQPRNMSGAEAESRAAVTPGTCEFLGNHTRHLRQDTGAEVLAPNRSSNSRRRRPTAPRSTSSPPPGGPSLPRASVRSEQEIGCLDAVSLEPRGRHPERRA